MLKRLPKSPPAFQLASFIDVVFNLLAFVLLVGSLESDLPKSLGVEIPRVPTIHATTETQRTPVVLRMDLEGTVWINDRQTPDHQLADVLRRLQTPETTTEIWADRRLPYERVVTILALVREKGGSHVKLMVIPESGYGLRVPSRE